MFALALMFLSSLALDAATSAGPKSSYWPYYDLVNQAEAAYLAGDTRNCFTLYDRAFASVEHPFTKDRVIAAQFAIDVKDTIRCLGYLRAAAADGMTRAAVEHIPILKATLTDPRFSRLFTEEIRPAWVDTVLRDSVYMRFYREQKVKEVMGRDPALRSRMQRITEENIAAWGAHLEQGRFPSERMIGLYSEEGLADFLERNALEPFRDALPPNIPGMTFGALIPEDVDLFNKTAWVDMLHSPCSWITYRDELWTAVGNGYLQPGDYCGLEEWLVKSRGNPNYLDTCTVERKPSYYNILFELRVEDADGLARVEKERREHHMQTYANDLLKRRWEKERGMALFFGFLNWR